MRRDRVRKRPIAAERIVVRSEPIMDYVLQLIAALNTSGGPIELYAEGRNICRLCDVVAIAKRRTGDSIRIVGWEINSRIVKGERKTFLSLLISYS